MATQKKTILVTGATAGIGRHAALHLAGKGHRVIATGRNEAALEKLRKEGGLETIRLDVTDKASIEAAVREVDRLTNRRGLDALVNNAGYGLAGALAELSDEDVRAQFDTNVFGLLAVTRAFLPKMRERGDGRIVNISSIGGRVTFPMFGAYHATKYAVEALSDALRTEVAAFGIKVVLVEPGAIKTEFGTRAVSLLGKYRSEESPYAPVYAQADKILAQADGFAPGPECVSRAIEKAITRRWPRARYVVPLSARFLLGLLGVMPTWVADGVKRVALGLTRKNLVERRAAAAPAPAAKAPVAVEKAPEKVAVAAR